MSSTKIDYDSIDRIISTGEKEQSLWEIQKSLPLASTTAEKSNLILLQAWVFYLNEDYDMAHQYLDKAYGHNDTITIRINLVRGLLYFKQGKLMNCYDSIQSILRIDPDSDDAKKMLKIFRQKTTVS